MANFNAVEQDYSSFLVDFFEQFSFLDMGIFIRQHLQLLSELFSSALLCASIITLWLNLQFVSNIIQVHWIWQIKNQLTLCTGLARKLMIKGNYVPHPRGNRKGANREDQMSINSARSSLADDKEKLVEYMTICYVNLMLFCYRHKSFKELMNFFISQAGFFAILSYGSLYLSTDFDGWDWKKLMIGTGLILSVCDLYLLWACLTSKSFEMLVKQQHYMMAYLADNALELKGKLIVKLWARQLMNRREIEDFIAPKFLNLRITMERFFSINTYILLLWFLIIRFDLQETEGKIFQ